MNRTAKLIICALTGLVVVLAVALVWVIARMPQREPVQAPSSPPMAQPGVGQSMEQPAQPSFPQAAAAPQVAPAQAKIEYVGNSRTLKLHRSDCEWAQKMADRNRVVFKSRDEALAQGYTPCAVCKP